MSVQRRPREQIYDDVNVALVLAEHGAAIDPAAGVLNRLRNDVEALIPAAEHAAEALPADTRRRDVGFSSVDFARGLLKKPALGDGTAHRLRIWAKTASILLAYTAEPSAGEHKSSVDARQGSSGAKAHPENGQSGGAW